MEVNGDLGVNKNYGDKFSLSLSLSSPYSGFLSRSIQAGATVQTAQDTPCKVTLQSSIPHPLGHYSPLTTTIDFFPDEDLAGI